MNYKEWTLQEIYDSGVNHMRTQGYYNQKMENGAWEGGYFGHSKCCVRGHLMNQGVQTQPISSRILMGNQFIDDTNPLESLIGHLECIYEGWSVMSKFAEPAEKIMKGLETYKTNRHTKTWESSFKRLANAFNLIYKEPLKMFNKQTNEVKELEEVL